MASDMLILEPATPGSLEITVTGGTAEERDRVCNAIRREFNGGDPTPIVAKIIPKEAGG